MARRTFFSFHYERDVWRSCQIRNSWVTQEREAAGFFDASLWEEAKKRGKDAVHKLIDDALNNTSVTVVLIGADTFGRDYVEYEIIESHKRGNGLVGVHIHGLRDQSGSTDAKGKTPFDNIYLPRNGQKVFFSKLYPTYDWVNDDGYKNLGDWVEKAAKAAGR